MIIMTDLIYRALFPLENQSHCASVILRTDGEADLLLLIGQSIIIVEVERLFSVVTGQHTLF